MLAGEAAYSIISIIAAALCFVTSAFINWRSPYLKTSQMLVIILCLGAIGCIFYQFVLYSPGQATAVLMEQVVIIISVGFIGAILYLMSMLPNQKGNGWFTNNQGLYIGIVSVSALIPATMVSDSSMSFSNTGFMLDQGLASATWLILVTIYTIVALFMLVAMWTTMKGPEGKKHLVILSIGVIFPCFSFFVSFLSFQNDLTLSVMASVGLLVAGLIIAFSVLNFKLFILEPSKDEKKVVELPEPIETTLKRGQCEMIESKRSDIAYRMFISSVAGGNQGLMITRVHPDQIKEKYGLVKTPVLWLAQQPGPDRIDPSSLSLLQHTIVEFLQRGTESIILLDGIEYLVSNNSAEKVQKLMYTIRDAVVMSGAKLIVPIDPEVLDKKDLALLEREFELMRPIEETSVPRWNSNLVHPTRKIGSFINVTRNELSRQE